MTRAPEPWHWWLLAFGKTIQWLIAYANQPGEAVGASIEVKQAAAPPPQQQEQHNG